MNIYKTPLKEKDIENLRVGDKIYLSGYIFTGRDAVLPKIVKLSNEGKLQKLNIDLQGSVIFHTAVSPAGIGPTSSNKLEIESSIVPLSKYGVKIHLGKGKISEDTIKGLDKYKSIYAVTPPTTALFNSKMSDCKVVAFKEEGMEAFHIIKVEKFPIIVAAASGKSIYDR